MDFVQMSTTVETAAVAQEIAHQLVDQRLAACVHVGGPITSTYRWDGSVGTSTEYVCTIKTRRDLVGEVEAAIRSLHPYDVPEVIVIPIEGGSSDYLDWISAETAPHEP